MESSVKVVHKKDAYDVYIGRPSIFGNPFPVEHYGRSECLKKFRDYFFQRIRTDPKFKKAIETLRGKTLACYCSPQACHGDIIEEDSYEIATALAARDLKVEFNIVRYNPFSPDYGEETELVDEFAKGLRLDTGMPVQVVPRVGKDCYASCGMFTK